MEKYNPQEIEPKWVKYWEEHPELCAAQNDSKKPKKYILDMFPYPSGEGLHAGHVESYTATDIVSRYLRMNGNNILHPQGWDAFGLPAENYAIKTKTHPAVTTKRAIENFTRQMKMMGFSYDWSREISSIDPQYYKWTQWFFLLLYKNGLAYKKKAKVNWCESCKTVLANEQVVDGKCERCGNPVMQKDLEQWFFKITDFIEDKNDTSGLISGLDKVDWPESTNAAQKNWIGRSEGTIIKFGIKSELSSDSIEVFTTRLDTIYGCTYLVMAPEHKLVQELKDRIKNWDEVEKYIKDAKKKTDLDRMENKDKTGVEIKNVKVINPFTKEELPLYIADYVLAQYGTGAVMAVPAHDERDWEFAKKYDLPIKQSIAKYFTGTGKDIPQLDKKTSKRKTVIAIVKHWEKDEYLCLDWKKFGWKSFVIGGVNENEGDEAAAIREMKEETGYQNVKSVKKIGNESHNYFYAAHKETNRYAETNCFYIELADDKQNLTAEEETVNHDFQWVPREEISAYINLSVHSWYWNIINNGESVFTDDGIVVNSGEYSALTSEEARKVMSEWLEKNNLGSKKVNYKLRDWLVSRQRYWGAPIPIIYCEKCGEVPVNEKDLPVMLPTDVDFKPTGESPLVYSKEFHNVKCPKCGGEARRESDTMDTFVCSSWYYFRYADTKNEKEFASKEMIEKWLPVDLYVGGAEHTVLHLLYSRFFTKVLHNLGYIDFDEPFLKLRHQGIILSEDGRKMSKSLGNVVSPDDEVKKHGADALRCFEMFMGPLEDMKPWQTNGIVGVSRFLEKVWRLKSKIQMSNDKSSSNLEIQNYKLTSLIHKTIKKVSEDIESLRFNTAISALMILTNEMDKQENVSIEDYEVLVILLSPFAPFISEEIWQQLGHQESIFKEKWPEYDEALMKDEEINLIIQINGKMRDKILVSVDISEEEAKKMALEQEKIKSFIGEKEIKKIIFVRGRLVNIVI
jgi:leucyl-tRNA synthetase